MRFGDASSTVPWGDFLFETSKHVSTYGDTGYNGWAAIDREVGMMNTHSMGELVTTVKGYGPRMIEGTAGRTKKIKPIVPSNIEKEVAQVMERLKTHGFSQAQRIVWDPISGLMAHDQQGFLIAEMPDSHFRKVRAPEFYWELEAAYRLGVPEVPFRLYITSINPEEFARYDPGSKAPIGYESGGTRTPRFPYLNRETVEKFQEALRERSSAAEVVGITPVGQRPGHIDVRDAFKPVDQLLMEEIRKLRSGYEPLLFGTMDHTAPNVMRILDEYPDWRPALDRPEPSWVTPGSGMVSDRPPESRSVVAAWEADQNKQYSQKILDTGKRWGLYDSKQITEAIQSSMREARVSAPPHLREPSMSFFPKMKQVEAPSAHIEAGRTGGLLYDQPGTGTNVPELPRPGKVLQFPSPQPPKWGIYGGKTPTPWKSPDLSKTFFQGTPWEVKTPWYMSPSGAQVQPPGPSPNLATMTPGEINMEALKWAKPAGMGPYWPVGVTNARTLNPAILDYSVSGRQPYGGEALAGSGPGRAHSLPRLARAGAQGFGGLARLAQQILKYTPK